MKIAPNGRTLYAVAEKVTVNQQGGVGIVPIKLANGTAGKIIDVTDAEAIAITANGRMAYVATGEKDTIASVNLATGRIERVIQLPRSNSAPRSYYGIALSPDDRTAYAVDGYGDIVPVNLASGSVGKGIVVPLGTAGPIAITPNGETAYVITGTGGNVGRGPEMADISPVDLVTGNSGNPIVVPNDANDIAISPNGRTVYVLTGTAVAGPGHSFIVPIDVSTGNPGKPILSISGESMGIAVAPGSG